MKRLLLGFILISTHQVFGQDAPDVIHLTVKANPAPVPALKYTLLPKATDIQPGNAATLYYRAFAPEWWGNIQRQPVEFWEKLDAARTMPLDKLKSQELQIPTSTLNEIGRAARREYCDWEMSPRVTEDGVLMLFPELQGFRQSMNFLAVQARQEMAAGNIDGAVYTLQTSLQFARHIGEGTTFINGLVGIAIGNIACQQIEELMQLPQMPNLYWAFAQMPRPFVDLRRSLGGELLMIKREFAAFEPLEKGPVSPEQAKNVVDFLASRSPYWDIKMDKASLAAEFAELYPKAKKALAAGGMTEAEIAKMPQNQVVLLFALRELRRLNDERVKWMALPYSEGHEGLKRVDDAAKLLAEKHDAPLFVTQFGAALNKVYLAQVRIDRRIAVLRCIEALKLHASETGKFPASLNDVKSVPIPLDPMVNRPFEYRLDGDAAILTAPLYGNSRGNGWQYEIKLAGAAK